MLELTFSLKQDNVCYVTLTDINGNKSILTGVIKNDM
jgi:hypothetical protein